MKAMPKPGDRRTCPRSARNAPWDRFVCPLALLLLASPGLAQTGFPFQDETLHYAVNWPSGLSLGDASFTAHRTASGWNFDMALDAGVPGFAVNDKVRSTATADLCSVELGRDLSHGAKASHEKTAFDQARNVAHRTTVVPEGAGTSELEIPACARDALAFLYYARRELGQGRVPPQQQVFFGPGYTVHMEYTGAQTITVAEKPAITDHLTVSVKGQKANLGFEMFFARDAARTPLLVKVPFSTATFSMELVR
jgi:Protein of unknown function (DUF3108)